MKTNKEQIMPQNYALSHFIRHGKLLLARMHFYDKNEEHLIFNLVSGFIRQNKAANFL
jgi:hypothetical protein